jgi:O-antigen ligase
MQLFRDAANIADSAAASDPSASTQAVNAAGTGRGSLWRLTIESIARRPVFGWGTEGIADYLKANSLDGNNRPHNEYLQYAAFYGIPAALVYITALCSIYRKAFKQLAELPAINICALLAGAGYLFSACFGNTMFYTAPFLFIMLGLGCYDPLPDKNEQTA